MGFLDLFKQKQPELPELDLSVLNTDVHSHLIPGIDDGSKSMEETIEMLLEFKALGYSKIITTPHIMVDYYKNTSEIILRGLDQVREELIKQHISLKIEAAAEYFLDDYFLNLIANKDILHFGSKYVLFELSFSGQGPYLPDAVFQLQMAGYKPVLAHVERYQYWHGIYDKYHEWKDKEVYFQLNTNSLSGHYGPGVRKAAEYLIDKNMYDFIGSDCHNMNHINLIKTTRKDPYLHKLISSNKLLNHKL